MKKYNPLTFDLKYRKNFTNNSRLCSRFTDCVSERIACYFVLNKSNSVNGAGDPKYSVCRWNHSRSCRLFRPSGVQVGRRVLSDPVQKIVISKDFGNIYIYNDFTIYNNHITNLISTINIPVEIRVNWFFSTM